MSLSLLSWCLAVCLQAATSGSPAAGVLHEWDVRRAAAWESADPAALRATYTPHSSAGRADVAMLRAWRERGLRIEGLRMQLLSVEVVSARHDRLVVDVADRVAAGVVVPGGAPLPRDEVTRHRMVLRQVEGEWLVAAVRDQARPARTTSATVRSWNW